MSRDSDYYLVSLFTPRSEGSSSSSSSLEMAKEEVTRKWEVFAGRNRFYCDGRLMTAPHSGVFLLTVFLITGTSILFFIFDCPYLAYNVTIFIPIIGGILFLFTMSALLRTSLTDPGIIPRATQDEAAYVEKQIEVTNSANSPTYRPPPRTKEVLIKGQTVKLKYCFTCKIFRPPRASHCSLCDNCVDRFDHHCPWVGNCVGRRNYRFFYMFIVSLAFLAVFIFACAVTHLILLTKDDGPFLEAIRASPASLIVGIVCFFSVWSILGLAGFHTYLTTSNQTTNEDIKGSFTGKSGQESFNPYSQGNVCFNCFHILCGPVTPSLIDRRGVVTDEYKSEIGKKVVTAEPTIALQSYITPVQIIDWDKTMQLCPNLTHFVSLKITEISMNGPPVNLSSEVPGVYRQTTENTGTYIPLKKQLQRTQHLVPSKNCAAHKIIPSSRVPLERYDFTEKRLRSSAPEFGAGNSLSRIKDVVVVGNESPDHLLHAGREISHRCSKHEPNERPFTPPEKRYSASFGVRAPERKHGGGNKRPRSSYVYENVHADDFCISMEYGKNRVKTDRSLQNVNVKNFPVPEFSRMYIQDRFQ